MRGRGQDKQGEALVIQEKSEVGEKMINKPEVGVKRRLPAAGLKRPMNRLESKQKDHQEVPQRELQVWRLRK